MSLEIVEENALDKGKIIKPNHDVIIYVDTEEYREDSRLKIFLQNEPEAIRPTEQYLLENGNKYDSILTIHESVIKKWPHAKLYQFYRCTWIDEKDYLSIKIEEKKFQISCLVGFKRITKGHMFRLTLYYNQEYLPSLIHFFRSGARHIIDNIKNNPILGTDPAEKIKLFKDYQFSLVIENSRQTNYFTEKLIDCLITKTIPIYYGCINIQDYFDTTGWIILTEETPFEFIEKINNLSESYYDKYKETIEKNYNTVLQYKELWGNFNATLKSIPGYL